MSSRSATSAWHGTVLVSTGHSLYVGPAGDTRPHRHHALQLVVALEGSFQAQLGSARPRTCESILVAADTEHRIEGRGLPLALYYVDGSCAEGRVLSGWLGREPARVLTHDAPELRKVLTAALERPSPAVLPFLREGVAELLQCRPPASPVGDPAVDAARALLEKTLGSPLPVAELAQRVGLRQRELSSRFRKETGLSIRRYVLWMKLKSAVSALAGRRTLTEAAQAAGFADAAHLSRTFVQMFGLAPSEILVDSKIQVLGQT